jgi:hypothetical protein
MTILAAINRDSPGDHVHVHGDATHDRQLLEED